MKRKISAKAVLALYLALCLVLAGCGKNQETEEGQQPETEASASPSASPSATPQPTPTPSPEPVTVTIQENGTEVDALSCMTSEVFQLQAVSSDGSTGGEWSSSNSETATVDVNGVVTCIKAGSVKITYTLGTATATCSLTITEPTVKILFGGAAKSDITLNSLWGFEIQLTAQVTPEDAAYEWTVDNPTIVSVSETGLVTALKAGTTTVHCKCGTAKASCVIRITENPPQAQGGTTTATATPDPNDTTPRVVITFWGEPSTDFTVRVGASVDMDYKLYNISGDQSVTWSIEDPEYATVDANGVVTGVKETTGEVTYTKLICTCGDVTGEAVVRVAKAA